MENSSTPEYKNKNKTSKQDQEKQLPTEQKEASPTQWGDKKLFQIIAQNTKQKVSTHPTEPHPGMPWQLY